MRPGTSPTNDADRSSKATPAACTRAWTAPCEPAAYGAALLRGPDVAKHRPGFDRLEAANAALTVADAEALAAGLNALSDPEKQSAMGAAAQAALRPQADARELVGAITQRLDAAS